MKHSMLFCVVLLSAINLPGYVRATTSGGTPLRRTDSDDGGNQRRLTTNDAEDHSPDW